MNDMHFQVSLFGVKCGFIVDTLHKSSHERGWRQTCNISGTNWDKWILFEGSESLTIVFLSNLTAKFKLQISYLNSFKHNKAWTPINKTLDVTMQSNQLFHCKKNHKAKHKNLCIWLLCMWWNWTLCIWWY